MVSMSPELLVHSVDCGTVRTIVLRTESREEGWEDTGAVVSHGRTTCDGTNGHKPSPPTVSITTGSAPDVLVGSRSRGPCIFSRNRFSYINF